MENLGEISKKHNAGEIISFGKHDIRISRQPILYFVIYSIISVSLLAKILYFQYETGLNKGNIFSKNNLSMLLCSIFFAVSIAALFSVIFKGRKALLVLFIVHTFFSILLISDINAMRYYYKPLSLFLLYDVNFKFFGAIDKAVYNIFKFSDMVLFLDLPIVLTAIIFTYRKYAVLTSNIRKKAAVLMTVSLVIIFSSYTITNATKADMPYKSNYTASIAGVLPSHFEDLYTFVTKKLLPHNKLTATEKKELADFIKDKKSEQAGTEMSGICSGKNLIVVQVEALQNFVIGLKVNGKEVTPNLNKLISESYYFNNMYYQVSWGNTSDAEFAANTSMYPMKNAAVFHAYTNNKFPSLPALLKQNGYSTSSFHALDPNFWNRINMHKALGFDRFYSETDFKMDDFAGWSGNALSDSSFFRQSIDKLDNNKPFYAFLTTVSTHFPYDWFENYAFDTGNTTKGLMSNYLKAANYIDDCIGQYMKDLEKRGILDNTVVVFYGDHFAIPQFESSQLLDLLGKKYSEQEWTQLQKVPCIIHVPGQKTGKTINKTCGEIDIFPTVANILGFKPFTIGKDLFNTTKGYAVLQNGSVITDDYMYISSQEKVYSLDGSNEYSIQQYSKDIKKLQDEQNLSSMIITKDAFKAKLPY